MKTTSLISSLGLSLLLSGCAAIGIPVSVPIDIPVRPVLAVCTERPVIEASIIEIEGIGPAVVLTLKDAVMLRTFIHTYMVCSEINQVELLGHIEKLENRLKVLKEE